MPEEKVEYKVEREPELICPLRLVSRIASIRDSELWQYACLKEKCAWWHSYDANTGMCAVLFVGDSNMALYEMLDEVRGKL